VSASKTPGVGKRQPPSLLATLLNDLLRRHWLITLLVVLNVWSAMQLATSSHQVRRATAKLQQLQQEYQQELAVFESMRLEMAALTEPDRVSSLAKRQLGMTQVTAENERVIEQ